MSVDRRRKEEESGGGVVKIKSLIYLITSLRHLVYDCLFAREGIAFEYAGRRQVSMKSNYATKQGYK